jgi:putative PIN family toxin of toxin-antitoxin system
MRVVLDTNVLVSALLFRGPAAAVHAAWASGRFVPLVSHPVLDEYIRVLAYPKFALTEEEIGWLIRHELLRWAEPVTVTTRVAAIGNDPADNRFLELAIDGQAELVVSGDAHLLDLGAWKGIPILTVRRFLDSLR